MPNPSSQSDDVRQQAIDDVLAVTDAGHALTKDDLAEGVHWVLLREYKTKVNTAGCRQSLREDPLLAYRVPSPRRDQRRLEVEHHARQLLRDGRYKRIVDVLKGFGGFHYRQQFNPSWATSPPRYEQSVPAFDARMKMHSGAPLDASMMHTPTTLLARWFSAPFPDDLYAELDPSVKCLVLSRLAEQRHLFSGGDNGLSTRMKALQSEVADTANEMLLAYAVEAEALWCDVDVHRQWHLGGFELGLWHLRRGDVKKSVSTFAEALKDGRSQVGNDYVPKDGAGLFLPVAYLASGQATKKKNIDTLVKRAWKANSGAAGVAWTELSENSPYLARLSESHPACALIAGLGRRWRRQPLGAELQLHLEQALARTQDAKMPWLASELQHVLDDVAEGLMALVDARAAWESQLGELGDVLQKLKKKRAKQTPTTTGAPQELFWKLTEMYSEEWSLTATDAKGKSVSDQRLLGLRGKLDVTAYTADDQAILQALRLNAQNVRIRACLVDDDPKLWRALMGHPRLYHDDVPLHVVERVPRLQLVKHPTRDVDVLLMKPPFDGEFVAVHVIESGLFEVTFFTEEQAAIGRSITDDGLEVPAGQRDKLQAIIDGSADFFPEQQEEEVTLTEVLDVVVLLDIEKGKLITRPSVLPFGRAGALFTPGAGPDAVIGKRDGKTVRLRRDLDDERQRVTRLQTWLKPITDEALRQQMSPLEEALLIAAGLDPHGVEVFWRKDAEDMYAKPPVRKAQGFNMKVRSRQDWLDAEAEVTLDDGTMLTLDDIVRVLQDAPMKGALDLGDDGYVQLDAFHLMKLKRLARLVRRREQKRQQEIELEEGAVRVHRLASDDLLDLAEHVDGSVDDGAKAWRHQWTTLPEHPPLPPLLQAQLRDYQVEAFQWLARLADIPTGAILADDMGLGKTLCALTLLLHRASKGPALVVVPTSLLRNWQDEAGRFAPSLRMHVFHGGNRKLDLASLSSSDVVLTTYGVMLSDIQKLEATRFSTLVLDESQALKNASTKRSKAALRLSSDMCLALTGTPIENHLGELHAQLQMVAPHLLPDEKDFRSRFVRPIEDGDEDVLAQLRTLVSPYVLRRTKAQVLQDLPPKTEVNLWVDLTVDEAENYDTLRKQAIHAVEDGAGHIELLAMLTRLRLTSCASHLAKDGPRLPSAKTQRFLQVVQDLLDGQHRVLVFSQFVKHLQHLESELRAVGHAPLYLDGQTSADERADRVRRFQEGEAPLFLISLKAGGTGLNLTAADYVLHMDPWWNPAVEDQASDRAHRIGQKRPVTIYRLISKGTIEEKVLALHADKRDLADKLIEGNIDSGKLTAKELAELLRQH